MTLWHPGHSTSQLLYLESLQSVSRYSVRCLSVADLWIVDPAGDEGLEDDGGRVLGEGIAEVIEAVIEAMVRVEAPLDAFEELGVGTVLDDLEHVSCVP